MWGKNVNYQRFAGEMGGQVNKKLYTNYFHCIRIPQSHVCLLNFIHVPATLRDPELILSDHYKEGTKHQL